MPGSAIAFLIQLCALTMGIQYYTEILEWACSVVGKWIMKCMRCKTKKKKRKNP